MALRAVFRASGGMGGLAWMAVTQSARDPAPARILAPSTITTKLPGWRSVEDHVDRVVGFDAATLAVALATGFGGVEHLTARRSRGGPETQGSEGAQPPASLRRGLTECGHTE